jgi:hypothetical protein
MIMHTLKFLDGTEVPKDYARAVSRLVDEAAAAAESCAPDALEAHAALQEKLRLEIQDEPREPAYSNIDADSGIAKYGEI